MAEVVWTERALNDLQAIYLFMARDTPEYARLVNYRLYQATTRLEDFPRSGRVVSEWDSDDVRELIAQSYRIIYRVMTEQDRVEVLLIHHGAMPLERLDPI
ncbi:MAG: type II toxin-antitoxin system RelE/ParE family toxin [Chloroflexi bacterium]|nr:type II toxin-antitoxin system RelE/ParE family toxin [Chloroflexota bacterium]